MKAGVSKEPSTMVPVGVPIEESRSFALGEANGLDTTRAEAAGCEARR